MTIGEYRKHLEEEMLKAVAAREYDHVKGMVTILESIDAVPDESPAKFLTFKQIMDVADEAIRLAGKMYEEGKITPRERRTLFFRFMALAESQKLKGSELDVDSLILLVDEPVF